MKAEIHPKYFEKATVTCACGAVFNLGSTKEHITVEICSQCHPFYTGTEKTLDAAGMVDKFKSRAAKAKAKK
jgi:large subunit ribosomal protein L31